MTPDEHLAPDTRTTSAHAPSSITCPRCRMTSFNPNDVREGYCGACHAWTSTPASEVLEHPLVDLKLLARVLDFHRARLREIAEGNAEDQHFTSGLAWGLYALERVDRALRGQTDSSLLGFESAPRNLPPLPPSRRTPG